MRDYLLENVVSGRDICLERLEDRLVLDGAVDQGVEEGHTDAIDHSMVATADVAPTLDDWFDGQWHWYGSDTWFKYENGWYWWFYDNSDTYYVQNATDGTWYYYNWNTSTWDYVNGWYYDSVGQVWIYSGVTFKSYYWSETQYMYEDFTTGKWYYYDSIDSKKWEPAFEWFYSSYTNAYEYNQKDVTNYYWAEYRQFQRFHESLAWEWFDTLDSQTWEDAFYWFWDPTIKVVDNAGTRYGAYCYNDWHGSQYSVMIQIDDAIIPGVSNPDVIPMNHLIYQDHRIAYNWWLWKGEAWESETAPYPLQ
ncbi:hypothetical protein [Desulfomonile tiedjei]|uniref:Uncharacterized protein n=1 Tax=Desulfomonile tiedjei (strain ATCC 49306 / DSM 6799 / DCB-1) TaxID=706587 RepID=I4C862_DESTA|nr:hypothetical protein [Desulfomonile tiedjei]AFM25753.1 hypothetical protein Desti_3091 [Desulfomonile tiedjei DSM 6799]